MIELQQALAHVLWIGGATDAGKTTVAQLIAARYGLQLYNYDRTDLPHHERLAQDSAAYRAFLAASLDERWVDPAPEELAQRALQSFRDRWPLVVRDLRALPGPVLAEGFGLTPDLLAPVLTSPRQAIWLVPTAAFKRAAMQRRNKPAWRDETRDPSRAAANLFQRDTLLAAQVQAQAQAHGLTVYEVDGSRSAQEMATLVEQHFAPFLPVRAPNETEE